MILEIIGPAGSGKSTISRALTVKKQQMVVELLPPVWNGKLIPFFIKNIIQILPLVLRSAVKKSDRQLTRRELAWMAILNGWPELLGRQNKGTQCITILDQGPIFLATILRGYGPTFLKEAKLERWWQRVYSKWSYTLDLVVWLDANDEILQSRINERMSDHIIKGKSSQEVSYFLANFRIIFDDILKIMKLNNPNLQIVSIDSGQNSADQVVEKILSQLECDALKPL